MVEANLDNIVLTDEEIKLMEEADEGEGKDNE